MKITHNGQKCKQFELNVYTGEKSKAEFGAGILYVKGELFEEFEEVIFTGSLGFRRQPEKGGPVFCAG